ncbi:MAG TPA: bifunctional oligoribonuclease/PAP phosphatase NrnA [Firmicutes bacterium]|nr:bifunctional oligoribonuclease/PAP phosphatase NrnA [Candidatus Fermentithermobacillaceae bacterium]
MAKKIPHRDKLEQIATIIAESKRVLILEHEKPDGDCIGSGLALALVVSSLGKKAMLLSQDPHPATYDFLPGAHLHTMTSCLEPEETDPDVTVFLDCTGPERAGEALSYARSKTWINIDHHVSNSQFGHASLVDPDAAATGELVFFLLKAMGAAIDTDVATCLYAALVSDTGGFRYQNTSPRCFHVAAELIDSGANPSQVADYLYETRSLSSLLLLKNALHTLALHKGGKLASIDVTAQMLKDARASFEDANSVIDYPRSIAGVEVALCFKENQDQATVHLSLRSRSKVDVSKVAVSLGGGGHPRAAGAVVEGTLEQVRARVFGVLDGLGIWTDS